MEQEHHAAAGLVHEAFLGLASDEPPQPELDEAVAALRNGVATGAWPYGRLSRVTAWQAVPPDHTMEPEQLWIYAAVCSLEPVDDAMEPNPELESAVATFVPEDWVTIVAALVAQGPGADASPDAILRLLQAQDVVDAGDEDLVLRRRGGGRSGLAGAGCDR